MTKRTNPTFVRTYIDGLVIKTEEVSDEMAVKTGIGGFTREKGVVFIFNETENYIFYSELTNNGASGRILKTDLEQGELDDPDLYVEMMPDIIRLEYEILAGKR